MHLELRTRRGRWGRERSGDGGQEVPPTKGPPRGSGPWRLEDLQGTRTSSARCQASALILCNPSPWACRGKRDTVLGSFTFFLFCIQRRRFRSSKTTGQISSKKGKQEKGGGFILLIYTLHRPPAPPVAPGRGQGWRTWRGWSGRECSPPLRFHQWDRGLLLNCREQRTERPVTAPDPAQRTPYEPSGLGPSKLPRALWGSRRSERVLRGHRTSWQSWDTNKGTQ